MPDGTKPLPKSMLTYHQCDHVAFAWWQFYRKYTVNQSMHLIMTYLYLQSHLLGTNELKYQYCMLWSFTPEPSMISSDLCFPVLCTRQWLIAIWKHSDHCIQVCIPTDYLPLGRSGEQGYRNAGVHIIPVKVTLDNSRSKWVIKFNSDISMSPIEHQWGSRKYPG